MKDFTISKKIDDKYQTLISLKEGWKFSITPTGKRELKAFLEGNDEWFNGTFKIWEAKPTEQSAHDTAKSNGYQAEPVEDIIPF